MTDAGWLSLSTACVSPLPAYVAARTAAEAGCDGIELVLGADELRREGAWMRRMADRLPVPVRSVHQPLYALGRWARPARVLGATVEQARQIGASIVVLHSPLTRSWNEPASRAWLAALDGAQAAAAESDITLTVENRGLHAGRVAPSVLGNLDDLAAFCRARGLGLTYDTCHAGTLAADLAGELSGIGDILANVHLSDYRPSGPFQTLPVLDMMAANHQYPGDGSLALAAALRALALQDYSGPITFEISPFALRAWLPSVRRSRLGQAVGFVREAFRQPAVQPQTETIPAG